MSGNDVFAVGLGAALLLKDKMEETVKRMRERGEQGRGEARTLCDRAEQRFDRERADFEARVKDKVRDVVKELGLATREDVEAAVRAKD